MQEQDLLSLAQAAKRLDVSKMTLYRVMNRGELPFIKLGRLRKIWVRDLESLIATHRYAVVP